jgi:hypothetical protein
MPTRTNKRTGEVQQLGPDGQWVSIKPGNPDAPTMIQTRAADPTLPDKRTITHNQAQASQFAPGKAQADNTIAQAQAANALAIAQAQRDKAVADAKTAQIDASGGRKLDPAVRKSAIEGYNNATGLLSTVDDLLKKFNAGPGATHGLHGMEDYLPYTANKQFDNAADKSRGLVGSTLGFTGGQLNTANEAAMNIGPYLPHSADRDAVASDKINYLRDLGNTGRTKAIQTLGGVPDENGNIIPVTKGAIKAPEADPLKLAGDTKTRSQIDPVLKATGTKVGAMLVNGTPDAQILHFLRDSGVPPESTSVMQALGERKKPGFQQWMRANPGKIYPVGPQFYTKEVPMSAARRVFNKTSQNDVVGAAEAGLAASANSIMGDRLGSAVGAASGDPAAAQTGMELLRTNHPAASFGGDLAGQATLEGLASLIPGAQGVMAARYGRRGADAAYGAYSGSGDSSQDAGVGGVLGGLGGLGFGMAGRGAQKALGNSFTGVRDAGLQYLHGKNIRLTLGQIARGVGDIGDSGSSNVGDEVGKDVAGLEDRLRGLPGIEGFINAARQRGDIDVNREMFRQVAPGVSGIGEAGLISAKRAETAAYDKLKDARLSVTPEFEQGVSQIGAAAKGSITTRATFKRSPMTFLPRSIMAR